VSRSENQAASLSLTNAPVMLSWGQGKAGLFQCEDCLASASSTSSPIMSFGGDFHRWKIFAVSDHQLRVLAQILLRPNAFLNLPLEFCDVNQWIFQPLMQLLGQSADDFHGCFSHGQSGSGLKI
jgi:hypothetical protein